MSREELGDAPADVATRTRSSRGLPRPPRPADDAADPARQTHPADPAHSTDPAKQADPADAADPAPTAPGRGSGSTGRRARGAVLAVVTALSALAGWAGSRGWAGSQDPDSLLGGPVAWAVVVDSRPRGGSSQRTLVDLVVRVTNLGRTPLSLNGAEASFDAGAIEAIGPDGASIAPGASIDAVALASIACRSPQPLRLYPLQVRRSDRSLRSVEIAGAAAALTRVCHAQGPDAQVLSLIRASEDGERLRVVVHSPTGRTTKVEGVHARGVAFTGRPLDGTFDARERVIWLDRPRTCPAEWLRTGLPRTLTFEVDPGGPATVTLDAGFALARWLRTAPCSGSGP